MEQLSVWQQTNRRALLAFVSVLSAVVILAALTVMLLQRQHLLTHEQENFQIEIALLGELSTEALLRADYATVENLIQRWLDTHENIAQIRAEMPNGFILAEVRRNTPMLAPIHLSQPVIYNGKTLLTLHVTSDVSDMQTGYIDIIIHTTLISLAFIFLLGWLLWHTIKRTALAPLQAQILGRAQQEQELVQRSAELESALRELETFSYSVSHDLRAPLRAIDGFSRIILEDHGQQLDAEGRGYLERVIAAVQRMSELIDDLLALSRVSRRELVMSEVNLSTLASDIMAEFREQAPQRQVKVEIAPDLIVRGDAQLLRVVMTNLLGNAWKYTSKKSAAHIEFACNQQGNAPPLYCVRDNGVGFDMQYADKLFQPFQRLHTPAEFPGTGIGLATVARVIERHGGRVWAEGQPGLGTIVCFSLVATARPGRLAAAIPAADKDQL